MNTSNHIKNRDLQYEQTNILYDKDYKQNRIKCKNYKLCNSTCPLDCYITEGHYLCMTCMPGCGGGFGWNELEFRESDKECSVCFDKSKKQLKFPTNCGHWFCISCSRNILFSDEQKYHLSPDPYGCPPCPNNCVNPIKGKQCSCEEYLEIQDKWEQDFPLEFKKWNDSEHLSIEQGETILGSVFGSCTCPLCRKKYY